MKSFNELKDGDIVYNATDGIMTVGYSDFFSETSEKELCFATPRCIWRGCQFDPADWECLEDVEAVRKLYGYIGRDIEYVEEDYKSDLLSECVGRDKRTYWWYMDTLTCVAIDAETLEIHEDEIFFSEQFE